MFKINEIKQIIILPDKFPSVNITLYTQLQSHNGHITERAMKVYCMLQLAVICYNIPVNVIVLPYLLLC